MKRNSHTRKVSIQNGKVIFDDRFLKYGFFVTKTLLGECKYDFLKQNYIIKIYSTYILMREKHNA